MEKGTIEIKRKRDDGLFSDTNTIYVVMGLSVVSMGVCVFLYREFTKIKSEINDLTKNVKEMKECKDKSMSDVDEKLNKMSMMFQKYMDTPQVCNIQKPTPVSVVTEAEEDNSLPIPSSQKSKIIITGGPEELN